MMRTARRTALALAATFSLSLLATSAMAAGPKVVAGPGHDAACYKPWTSSIKFLQWEKRPGPYRVALVNGFVGNTWRIQMIQTAKAYAEQPGIKEQLKELKVVSTGTDVAAQLGAIEDFINQGFDAIITIAVAPDGFDRVIRLADRNNVVLVPFDNVLDTDKVMMVNEDQTEIGRISARWLLEQLGTKRDGKVLEVRGLAGNSVDRDRHLGFREVIEKEGKFQIIEIVGNWDDGTAQKATADALAVHGRFEAVFTQGGSTGTVRALVDAGHPFVPMAGEGENGYRKFIAMHAKDGLKGLSYGQSPGLVAMAMKAAISALEGNAMPQLISAPIPVADYTNLEAGVNYWPDLTDNFFTPNEFPACNIKLTAPEIIGQTAQNTN